MMKRTKFTGHQHKRTQALAISKAVKDAVFERDLQRCVWCGSSAGLPEAHFISRAQSGLGIEENVVTLCRPCHDLYDHSGRRQEIRNFLALYLATCYIGWDESKLVYKKEF